MTFINIDQANIADTAQEWGTSDSSAMGKMSGRIVALKCKSYQYSLDQKTSDSILNSFFQRYFDIPIMYLRHMTWNKIKSVPLLMYLMHLKPALMYIYVHSE